MESAGYPKLTRDHHEFCVISLHCLYDPEVTIWEWGMKYFKVLVLLEELLLELFWN